jgi:hypothetical protein
MLTVEPFQTFDGFGTNIPQGLTSVTKEYFYSQGMNKSPFGIVPGWKVSKVKDEVDLPTLGLINFFAQGSFGSSQYVAGVDGNGYIYRNDVGTENQSLQYQVSGNNHGNGIFFDQKNRLLVATDRYLAKCDGSADYTTGTVQVFNGSTSVIGTGTSWDGTMNGKLFRVSGSTKFYKINNVIGATALTLTATYTEANATGQNYTVYTSWTEQWKDFGASYETNGYRQMDNFEDWVVIANLNAIALLNVTDDSFNNIALNLPAGYNLRCVRAGRTGILAGLNFNNKGAVLLWDAFSNRSITNWIWFNSNIKAIVPTDEGWYVITTRGIYLTNGYTKSTIIESLIDSRKNTGSIFPNLLPQGVELIENYLVFMGSYAGVNRMPTGIYLFNLNTKLFEYAPISNSVMSSNAAMGAIFFDNTATIHTAYTTSTPAKKFIGKLQNTNPAQALLISPQLGTQSLNEKVAEGVKLTFGLNTKQTETADMTFDVSVKIANMRKNLWGYVQTAAISASTITLKVDATAWSYKASVGDEVIMLDGTNAGSVRHIANITNAGLATEIWTLNAALAGNTESGILVKTSRFKLARKYSFSAISELKELYFDIQNKIKGKKFLVEILLENMPANLELELKEGQFIYDDLGIKR